MFELWLVPSTGEDPESFIFVGALMDVTGLKRAEEERERLRQIEADLVYTNRVSMMGELAASLAHEIKQPIGAAAINGQTCSEMAATCRAQCDRGIEVCLGNGRERDARRRHHRPRQLALPARYAGAGICRPE